MSSGRPFLEVWLEYQSKVDKTIDSKECFEKSPVCKYPKGGCICKRLRSNGDIARCVYKGGPDKCCFEREEPEEILIKSR